MKPWSRAATAGSGRRVPSACCAAALFFALSLSACSESNPSTGPKKDSNPAVPVMTASVAARTVPLNVQAIGNVEPYATVAIKSRVDGQIVKVFFSDGDDVKQGQPLFQLDPRPFQAALDQSQANLLRDKAQLQHAQAQEARYKDLLQKNFVSKDAYAQYLTNVDTAQATVRADEAAVENARLQLDYATIHAPIGGRTGKIMVQLGNLVKANDTGPLVVINQIAPVYVSFAVPEQYLPEIRRYMGAGRLPVQARIPDTKANVESGDLAFIDNAVDTTTGTVRLRAVFSNRDGALWPGQFVTAVLTLHEQRDAIVVPSQAVQNGPKGEYVYVVKADLSTELRPVVVDRTEGADSVIAKGLAAGERVVTTGQLRLTPGMKVNPKAESGS